MNYIGKVDFIWNEIDVKDKKKRNYNHLLAAKLVFFIELLI